MFRLCLSVGVVCLGLWGCSAVALGAPARFWFSLSPDHPLPATNSSGTLEVELTRASTIDSRNGVTLYIWAQPGTDTSGQMRQLQSLTLNIVTAQPLVNLDTAKIENPTFQISGSPPHSQQRFESVRDSVTIVPHNPDLTLSSKSPSEITSGSADRMDNLLAASPTLMGVTPGAGFGPTPIDGDPTFHMTTGHGPVWRLGSVRVESLTSLGEVPIHLQIGSSGMRHADGTTSSTDVIFAPPGKAGPVYNAGPEGDSNLDGTINYAFRNKTLSGDSPDALIRIIDGIPGDFNKDGHVDARDYTVWRNGYGERYGMEDYVEWKENYGRLTGDHGSMLGNKADSTVPEPSMLAVLLGLCCLRWFRTECLDPNSHRHSAPPLIITALLFCTLLSGRSLYADNISWDGSSDRNFNTPENWTNANGSNRKPGGLDNAIFGTENAQRLDRINLHGDQAVNAIRFRNVNSNVLISDQNLGQSIYVGPGGVGVDAGFGGAQVDFDSGIIVASPSHTWNVEEQGKSLRVRAVNLNGNLVQLTGAGEVVVYAGFWGPAGNITMNMAGTGRLRLEGNAPGIINNLTINSGVAVVSPSASDKVVTYIMGGGTLRADPNATAEVRMYQLAMSATSNIDTNLRDITFTGAISGTGNINKVGGGRLRLEGDAQGYSGTIVVNAGVLDGFTSAIRGNVVNNANVSIIGGGTYGGNMSGTGTLVKSGEGELTLTGSNSYGPTQVNGGTLQIGNGGTTGTLGTGETSIAAGAILAFNRSNQYAYGAKISGQGSLTKHGAGELVLQAANDYSGGTTVYAGTLHGNSLTVQGHIANHATVLFNQATFNGDYYGNMSGAGALQKHGNFMLTLHGSNSYSGDTTIFGGAIRLANHHRLSDTSNVVIHGGGLDLNNFSDTIGGLAGGGNVSLGGGTLTVGANHTSAESGATISGSGSLIKTGTGTQTLTGNNIYGSTIINQGTLQIGNGGTTGTLGTGNTSIAAGANLTFNRSDNITYSHVASGGGSLTKTGAGVLTLSGAQGYTGSTSINGGTLQLGNHNRIHDSSPVVINSGTLSLNGFSETIASLSGGGSVSLGTGVLTVGANGASTTYSGVVSGTGSLTKTGSGTLILGGINTYTGGTVIDAGTIATAAWSGNTTGTFAGGSLVTINGATLRLDGGDSLGYFSGAPILQNNGGVITTNGSAAHSNLGQVRLRGATLTAVGEGSGPSAGNFILNDVLESQASSTTSIISASRITLRAGMGGVFDVADGTAFQDLVISSQLGDHAGSAGLTKNGAGTMVLSGVSTYTGGTTVNAGRLNVTGSVLGPVTINGGRFHANGSAAGNVLVQPAGTLGGSGTIGGNVTGPGRVAPGNSPGILTINGDYTMTAGSVLEIEVEGTSSAGDDYDLLRVGGNVTLRGELTFDFRNNPSPALGDNITFLETFGGGEVLLVPDAEKPRITTTGLNPNSDLAVRVTSHVGVGGTVEMELVPAEDVFFDGVADSTSWFNASDWSTNSAPNETTDTRVGGNVFIQTGVAQRVIVSTQPANVRQLTVGDSMQPVVVEVETALHSVTGDVVVESNGEIELNGGMLSVGSTRSIKVVDTGSLTGHGSIAGALEVGMEGTAGAMLSPGTAVAGEEVGFIAIAGSYTQGADASLAIDIRGDNSGGNHDALSIAGNATLGGRLTIDVTDLTDAEFVPGASYTLGTVGGTLDGQFDAVEVVGRDDIYFSINYGGPGALLGEGAAISVVEQFTADGYYKGDGNQDRVVDERDIPIFAAVLANPELTNFYFVNEHGDIQPAAANFLDAFDFYTQGAPAGTRLVDFDDAPIFAEVLAAHTGTSLASAQAAIAAAIAEAQRPRAVPEPATLFFAGCVSMFGWKAIRRRQRP